MNDVPRLDGVMYDVPRLDGVMYDVPRLDGGMYDVPRLHGGMQDIPRLDGGMYDVPMLDGGMQDVPRLDGGMLFTCDRVATLWRCSMSTARQFLKWGGRLLITRLSCSITRPGSSSPLVGNSFAILGKAMNFC